MIDNELLKLNIQLLKMNLEGPAKEVSINTNSKGKNLKSVLGIMHLNLDKEVIVLTIWKIILYYLIIRKKKGNSMFAC